MPKVSKVKSKKQKLDGATSNTPEKKSYICYRCGREFSSQRSNFPKSHSSLYKYNNQHIHICRDCVDFMFNRYADLLNSEKRAMEIICQRLDIYWSESIYESVIKKDASRSIPIYYIAMTNLSQHEGKTYDNTIREIETNKVGIMYGETISDTAEEVTQDIVDFWGGGLTPSHYAELEKRLDKWKDGRDLASLDMGELTVIKQICMLEVQINLDAAAGKSIDKNVKALDSLLGSGNLRPVQKKTDDSDGKEDKTPFGVWINRIENDEPIPEPDEEFKDVDGIVKYVSTWFLGHMCKMLKVNNRFSNLYEEELAKLTVERPEYEGDDDEDIVEDIFERANKAAEIASKMSEEDEYDEL